MNTIHRQNDVFRQEDPADPEVDLSTTEDTELSEAEIVLEELLKRGA